MLPRLGLRTRVALLIGLGVAAVAVGVALTLVNTVRLHHDSLQTARADAFLAAVINAERIVVDAETGLRGYVITRRQLFLAPTRAAQASLAGVTATLLDAASGDAADSDRARALAAADRSYLTGYVPAVISLTRQNPGAARSYQVTLLGKNLVDHVRMLTARLESVVSANERERQRAARLQAAHATTEAVAVLIGLTLLTLFLGAVLGRLVISRDDARRRSEETTAVLRQSLLPSAIPVIPHCELAARFMPARAAELVGGDFYDVYPAGPDRWAIAVGDVCGKGADAAAVTAMARWTLRAQALAGASADEALRFLNRAMLDLELGGRFVTVAFVLVEARGGRVHVQVACGGHPPPLVVPSAGEPRPVPARGTLLGIWPDLRLADAELGLSDGDALVLYTDGVSDPGPGPRRDPAMALRDRPARASAEQLAELLAEYARQPAGPQRDDVAILALRYCDGRVGG